MEKNMVSVIIPAWNRKESLKRAIESVLMQEDVSLEVLVCDDGSTDGSVEMVSSWPDSRVRLLSGPRGKRPAIPRNRGIKAAKDEWLAFLDDDDEWLPGKLKAQIDFASEKGYLAVTTNALRKIPGHNETPPYHTCEIPECCDFKTLVNLNYVITSSVIVHSSLFKRVKGFPESAKLTAREDYALWLRVSSITPFGYIKEPYIIYTDIPSQSIRKHGGKRRKAEAQVYRNWFFWAKLPVFSRNGILILGRLFILMFPKKVIDKINRVFNKS